MIRRCRRQLIQLSLALCAASVPGRAEAALYTITTLDEIDVDDCTLRDALLAAEDDATHGLCLGDVGADTIVLEAVGTYELNNGGIGLNGRQLTVRGDGDHASSAYVVDMTGNQRFLSPANGAQLTLENLTLTHGGSSNLGGALQVTDSDLTMRRVTISASHASDGGGVAFFASKAQTIDLTECAFLDNTGSADQTRGGGLYVQLENGGLAKIVATQFSGNSLQASTGSFVRQGGGLYVQGSGSASLVLRALRFDGNQIDAPSFASGAGAFLSLSGTGSLQLEDAQFDGNELVGAPTAGSAVALRVNVDGVSATLRRLRLVSSLAAPGVDQAVVLVQNAAQVLLSDLLVADGAGGGIFLETSGASCSMVAGNLTVTGHPGAGISFAEGACPLRIENSIVYDNSPNTNSFGGSPEISTETLVGVDPLFVDAANGDFRLAPLSPAIDAGDQTFGSVGPLDAAHAARVVGSEVDLGAFERGAIFSDGFDQGEAFAWSLSVP